jgi:protein-S-isoprenylcysteine O-methyltransferase Ste14
MKFIYFVYGVVCYVMFLGTFLYAVGFVGNFVVPKSMDSGPETPLGIALTINMLLLGVFAVQHSVMARPAFKRWWTTIIPAPIERSTYVLFTNLALILLFWQWRPMGAVIWDVSDGPIAYLMWGLCALGWITVLISTCLIDHFELFGLRQVTFYLRGKTDSDLPFRTPLFYKHVRHPIYVGFIVAFWATPIMTVAHFVFALGVTGYAVIGALLEERDLMGHFGDRYREYKNAVPMLIPRLRRKR